MRVDAFDYQLPQELIAQVPAPARDQSRLMVVHRVSRRIEHRFFYNLNEYLMPGDVLVLNNTKVRAARLFGHKETGGDVEVLLLEPLSHGYTKTGSSLWEALIHARKKPRAGARITFSPQLSAEVLRQKGNGLWEIALKAHGDTEEIIKECGQPPLPPYIKRPKRSQGTEDRSRYQTIFAEKIGSAAAPTAGLHFTGELLEQLKRQRVEVVMVTLHVGLGTFQTVRAEMVADHRMHHEYYDVEPEAAHIIRRTAQSGKRVIACGTTSVRVVEAIKDPQRPLRGHTDLFIYPGYRFEVIQGIITNFHLPRSTLLMLVSAFAGQDLIFRAYHEAIELRYRFYSYGDAMLIV